MKVYTADRYPKYLYVADERYQIKLVSKIPGESNNCMGLCDDGEKIIWIKKTLSPMGLFRTLMHEALHAIECEYDLKLKHKQVWALERALTALLVDNE